ncbi:MAG: hypothetical protein J3R72DRAFT_473909 [Linnemannia gamsii]|nr:MAG: hypothetical protein J3R72DRAFT_473909 [Linnemannia gamsii]
MLGTSTARIRQILILICLTCIFLFSLIIMGLVGVNGNVTFRDLNKGCLLYMTVDGDVSTYNNGFCLFPIVGAAVTAVMSLLFLIILAMVLRRKDEFSPRAWSITVMFFSGLLALLSFAMCGEIGLGLNKGCRLLGDQINRCRSTKNFNALYGAQISAGIMGGLWLIAMILEVFQLKSRPTLLSANTVDIAGQTTVVPSRKNKNNTSGVSTSNISNPNLISTSSTSTTHLTSASTPGLTPAPAQAHIDPYNQHPEMAAYHTQNSQVQQQYYQQTPQLAYQQVQQTPQLQYSQAQQTPQLQYQQIPQKQEVYQQHTPILQNQPLPPHQQVYQPQQQQQAPLQLQQPYPTVPTPVAEFYPEQGVSVDTLPSTTTTTTISSTSNNVH